MNATCEQHATMNAQLVLARQILSEDYNATIDSRNVFIKGDKLICEIYQQNIPSVYLNDRLDSAIYNHPDDKIRDNSVRVYFK